MNNLGSKNYFPKFSFERSLEKLLSTFISQYYYGNNIPNEILISRISRDVGLSKEVLKIKFRHSVQLSKPRHDNSICWIKIAKINVYIIPNQRFNSYDNIFKSLKLLRYIFKIDKTPKQI